MLTPDGQPIDGNDRKKLESGELVIQLTEVSGTGTKKAVSVGLVNGSPETVIDVLTDYDNFTTFMPYCETVRVQKQEGERSSVYFSLDFPWPIGDRHYVLDLVKQRHDISGLVVYMSEWTYEKGSGNINDSTGSWEVRAYDDTRAFVRYTVFTDPGGSIPDWAKNAATEIAIPKVFKGLRSRVESIEKDKTSNAGKD